MRRQHSGHPLGFIRLNQQMIRSIHPIQEAPNAPKNRSTRQYSPWLNAVQIFLREALPLILRATPYDSTERLQLFHRQYA